MIIKNEEEEQWEPHRMGVSCLLSVPRIDLTASSLYFNSQAFPHSFILFHTLNHPPPPPLLCCLGNWLSTFLTLYTLSSTIRRTSPADKQITSKHISTPGTLPAFWEPNFDPSAGALRKLAASWLMKLEGVDRDTYRDHIRI